MSLRISFILFDIFFVTPLIASLRDFSVWDDIKSLIDSASTRSILPFKKALLVNSPGSACMHPFNKSNSKILLVVAGPPWEFISTISSIVNVFGANITETNTSSIISLLNTICP